MATIVKALSRGLIALVRTYQFLLSPWLGQHCRFTPTCSQFAICAIERHGPFKGSYIALCRLARCHPWQAGGYDPVPEHTHKTHKDG